MKHGLYISAHCYRILAETQEDTQQCRPKGGSWQEVVVKNGPLELKGAVKDYPSFVVMMYNVVWYIPRFQQRYESLRESASPHNQNLSTS